MRNLLTSRNSFQRPLFTNSGHLRSYLGEGGSVAEWFRALDLKSGGPWLKSSTLLLSGFVPGGPEFNPLTA